MYNDWYVHRLDCFPEIRDNFIELGYVTIRQETLSVEESLVWRLLGFDYYYAYSDSLNTWRAAKNLEDRLISELAELPKDSPLRTLGDNKALIESRVIELVKEHHRPLWDAYTDKTWRRKTFFRLIGLRRDTVENITDMLASVYSDIATLHDRVPLASKLMYEDRLSLVCEDVGMSVGPTSQQARRLSEELEKKGVEDVFYRGCLLPETVKNALVKLALLYPTIHDVLKEHHEDVPLIFNLITRTLPPSDRMQVSLTPAPDHGSRMVVEHDLKDGTFDYTHLLTVQSLRGYSWRLNVYINL